MKYYDHALNHKVIFQIDVDSEIWWWNGCKYDVLSLAKSLVFNNYHMVKMINSDGIEYQADKIEKMRY